jgi:hypothetical protein
MIELKNHFGDLLEHCKKFIMVITHLMRLDNFNACKNNMRDTSTYISNRKSKTYSLASQLDEDYHLLTSKLLSEHFTRSCV